jgi:hypothetical protein
MGFGKLFLTDVITILFLNPSISCPGITRQQSLPYQHKRSSPCQDSSTQSMHKFTESTQLIWQAEGGTINDKGMFHAGEIEGAYRLSMSAGTLNVYADVTI